MSPGYFRFPTVRQDRVAFVSEDDLWEVPLSGGVARRLTSNLSSVTYPMYSPDGEWLAYVGREEGSPDVYVMPARGGSARRLTFVASECRILCWDDKSRSILFATSYGQGQRSVYEIYRVALENVNGAIEKLEYGPAHSIAFGPSGETIIGRNTGDPARWKRYRGGTAGQFWIDPEGTGRFSRFLAHLEGNLASPIWLQTGDDESGRIYFISDHEGLGNLYSVRPDGEDLQRHTDHDAYFARNPSTDGTRIVYHAGADLFTFDAATGEGGPIDVDYYSPQVQRSRKFVSAGRYLDSFALNPRGTALTITSRGKAFAFYNHEGAILQLGERDGVRYRLAEYLNDGRRIVMVSDSAGEEAIEIHSLSPEIAPRRLDDLSFGRAVELRVSPTDDRIALSNHRHELLVIDLETGESVLVDRSPFRRISGVDWSPDGRWLAYGFAATHQTTEIRLHRLAEPEAEDEELRSSLTASVTQPVLHDVRPTFDPDGNFLYFLSYREFNPVYDGLHFDLGFPRGTRPYLLTLQSDTPNPFVPRVASIDDEEEDANEAGDEGESEEEETEDEETSLDLDDDLEGDEDPLEDEDDLEDELEDEFDDEEQDDESSKAGGGRLESDGTTFESTAESVDQPQKEDGADQKQEKNEKGIERLQIDLEGIEQRILAFPVPEGRYGQIEAISGRALFTIFPIRGSLGPSGDDEDDEDSGSLLRMWNFRDYRAETLIEEVQWFDLSRNRKKLIYVSDHRLRVVSAGEKPSNNGPSRKTGWIGLGRVKVSVDPQSEWEQMFREAWRLQRDHFWNERMSEVDWQTVYHRYFPLIERLSTRSEFSDLMWEMQGELGTSHAYEFGGDYRPRPSYHQGFLAADLRWDGDAGGYRVDNIVRGDPWEPSADSPLAGPGLKIAADEVIIAVNGQRVDADLSPTQLLVNQAQEEVALTLKQQDSEGKSPQETSGDDTGGAPVANGAKETRTIVVKTLADERPARYRAWVNANRGEVHRATGGRVGYVHIPDMGARGFAEFHRGYLAEVDKEALIVDVRFNGGGHVSSLLLEKLARRRLGYDLERWGGLTPYPRESVGGPLVALTNEFAGSDGDIFCHSFKLMGLGPLIGKRTWGGVVGIWPRHALVDGTVTTQPEFSFWFEDVGWNVENYGTDPDIEVDISPQDYREGRDPQLETGIETILGLLEANPPLTPPDPSNLPSRALPKLPPRSGSGE